MLPMHPYVIFQHLSKRTKKVCSMLCAFECYPRIDNETRLGILGWPFVPERNLLLHRCFLSLSLKTHQQRGSNTHMPLINSH